MARARGTPADAAAAAALAFPRAALLGGVPYRVLVTAAGTGQSSAGRHAVTRWHQDRIENHDGVVAYLRDAESGVLWSTGARPAPGPGGPCDARWSPGRFEIQRIVDDIASRLEVWVAPDAPAELRRLTIHNRSQRRRRIEVSSFIEVALNLPAAHAAHPAFSKLFVQTELVSERGALLARRRPRGHDERHPWLVHTLLGPGALEHESDRALFVGRGRSLAGPVALTRSAPLSGTTGNVLDPVLSLRRSMELDPDERGALALVLGAEETRDQALGLASRWPDLDAVRRSFEDAESAARARLEMLGVSEPQAERFEAVASAMLYRDPRLRAPVEVLERAQGDPERLSRLGIQLDSPIVVLDATRLDSLRHLPEMALARAYWLSLGLPCQLVVLCDDPARVSEDHQAIVLRPKDMSPGEPDLLLAVADLVVHEDHPFTEVTPSTAADLPARGTPAPAKTRAHPMWDSTAEPEPLSFFNGLGGFAPGGREYVIRLEPDVSGLALPPLPWINVIANERFGFLVSETGAGCTWSGNSREHRLTPWSNDPVLDPHPEAFFIRDDETRTAWSPLPGPVTDGERYEIRHGFGYSRCLHQHEDLESETTLLVPRHDPVKVTRVRLTNHGSHPRRLSLWAYQRLVLGTVPEAGSRYVITEPAPDGHALLARRRVTEAIGEAVAFAAALTPPSTRAVHWSADRESFLGPSGDLAAPAALDRPTLNGRTGAGLDPCFVLQVVLEIPAGQTIECAFLLGEGRDADETRELLSRYRVPGAMDAAYHEVAAFWDDLLSAVQVQTPSPAIDLMVNGWLLYQALACRMWGRSAFYQASGALGYRDQLQDASAFCMIRPELTRSQILLHAAHQFVEGDVLHWWHPHDSRGIRTGFVDDRLWLPYVTATYVRTTGDRAILDEPIRFLEAQGLEEGEDEAFVSPHESHETASLYEHCRRAIERSMSTGRHGLPLFGTGDWNDGMNRVGRQGQGESVWMGFFLYAVLGDFAPLCEERGDRSSATRYREHRERLREALETSAWDGEWYRRGFYDSGAVLGSRDSEECRIDALPQAWAVLSRAAAPERARSAMASAERYLVAEHEKLIRVLDPPFVDTAEDPGYIKGYVAGVRENGGQYTHAALWVVRALAELGRNDRAGRLLEMLSPVSHTRTPEEVASYRVEPYVVAADVYGVAPHVGRGGWSWYTGSAAWMHRVALESVFGIRMGEGRDLVVRPCVPDEWPEFQVTLRLPGQQTRYEVRVTNPIRRASAVTAATVDGSAVKIREGAAWIPLASDGGLHRVDVTLGPLDRAAVPSLAIDTGVEHAQPIPAAAGSTGTDLG